MLLYKLNEKSITEKYCVNKNVAGSCCKGKCHLNKTIAKSEDENEKNPFSNLNVKVKEVEVFCQQLQNLSSFEIITDKLNTIYLYSPLLLEGVSSSLIKPPTVLG